MNTKDYSGRRWLYPIGPAPEGWEETGPGCSRTIPHDEASGDDSWQNDEMNLDHYKNVRFVVMGETFYEAGSILGVFDTLHDAAKFVKSFTLAHPRYYDAYDIEAWQGDLQINVPNIWQDAIKF